MSRKIILLIMKTILRIAKNISILYERLCKASVKLCVKCLEGTTERSDSNRGRSPRIAVAKLMCLEGTTPQDMPQLSALIEFVSIRATEQVAIFEAHCIRVNSCNSWAKKRFVD